MVSADPAVPSVASGLVAAEELSNGSGSPTPSCRAPSATLNTAIARTSDDPRIIRKWLTFTSSPHAAEPLPAFFRIFRAHSGKKGHQRGAVGNALLRN